MGITLLSSCLEQMTPHGCRALCEYQATLLQSSSCKTLMSCERCFWPMDQSGLLPVMESAKPWCRKPKASKRGRRPVSHAWQSYPERLVVQSDKAVLGSSSCQKIKGEVTWGHLSTCLFFCGLPYRLSVTLVSLWHRYRERGSPGLRTSQL